MPASLAPLPSPLKPRSRAVSARAVSARAPSARTKLLDTALRVIREQGYGATSVDELCAAAGVTKGAFFHHFATKQALGVAAAAHWSATTARIFEGAPYHSHADPLDRILGYIAFRAWLIGGTTAQFTCLAGTMAQEIFRSHPAIRDACYTSISDNAAALEDDLSAAIAAYGAPDGVTAHSLAMHIQCVLQGAFVIAKAKDDAGFAIESLSHLRRYFELLFGSEASETDPAEVAAQNAAQNAAMRAHLESLFWTGQPQTGQPQGEKT